jgi:hypothetical protein
MKRLIFLPIFLCAFSGCNPKSNSAAKKETMSIEDADPRLKNYVQSLVETWNASKVLLATWKDFQTLAQFPSGAHFRDMPFSQAEREVNQLTKSTDQFSARVATLNRAYSGMQSSGVEFVKFRPDLEDQYKNIRFSRSFAFNLEDSVATKELDRLNEKIVAMLKELGAQIEINETKM